MKGYFELADLAGRRLGRMTIEDDGELRFEAVEEDAREILSSITSEISGKKLSLRGVSVGDAKGAGREAFFSVEVEKSSDDYFYAVFHELGKHEVRVIDMGRDE